MKSTKTHIQRLLRRKAPRNDVIAQNYLVIASVAKQSIIQGKLNDIKEI